MRLDKYLKVCRIIKRRSVSKDIISFGQVNLNNRKSKPSSEVKIGDKITLTLGNRLITIEVLSLNEKVRKEEAISLYKIIEEKEILPPEEAYTFLGGFFMNNQTLKLTNRESLELTNAKKVISFNPNEFLIESPYGNIKVTGKNLSIGKMDTDKQELCIKGYIDKFEYLNKSNKDEKKEGVFTKLFK